MADRDAEVQLAVDRAVRALAYRVRLVASVADPDAWAREYVEALLRSADSWWPRMGPPPKAPPNPRNSVHADAARKLLAERSTGPIPTVTDEGTE